MAGSLKCRLATKTTRGRMEPIVSYRELQTSEMGEQAGYVDVSGVQGCFLDQECYSVVATIDHSEDSFDIKQSKTPIVRRQEVMGSNVKNRSGDFMQSEDLFSKKAEPGVKSNICLTAIMPLVLHLIKATQCRSSKRE